MTTKTTKTDLADRLADHEDRLRRLEDWVEGTVYFKPQGAVTGPPIYDDDTSPLEEAAGDRPVAQGYNLVIGLNNTATNDPCAICGNRTDPEVGPELFLAGSEALVCYDCGRKHAPALVDLLRHDRESPFSAARRLVDACQAGEVVTEGYPLRLGGKGLFVADVTAYPKDLGYLLRSVEEKPTAVLHTSLEKEGLLFTPPHPEGLYWAEAVWASTPDSEDPPRWKATLVALTIRLDRFQALQEPTSDKGLTAFDVPF